MRKIACMLSVAAVLATVGCGGGEIEREIATFAEPDPERWEVGDHPLGRGELEPQNVSFGDAGLTLTLPAGTTNGGEVTGTEWRGDGTFKARMRSAASPGAISAFFLYRHDFDTDSSDEVDFEIPGGEPHRVIVTVWRAGVKEPAAQTEVPLDFDPSAEMHDYEFRRDGASVSFLIDGEEVFSDDEAPTSTMRPYFNAWYPTWQEPAAPPVGGEMVVERYEFGS